MHPLVARMRMPVAAGLLALVALFAHAEQRYFTYSYEPKVLPKGAIELEQWGTMRNGRDGLYTRWDIRNEFEIGLTDRVTTALYLNWTNKWVPEKNLNSTYFRGWSSEWKVKLLDPTADPIGVLLYGEIAGDRREWEAETKLVLGKTFGNVIAVVNAVFENEWKTKLAEDDSNASEIETEQVYEATAGVSYRWTRIALGLEARSHTIVEEGESYSAFFAGPVVQLSGPRWWATFTLLVQTTNELDAHERTESRLILGIDL